MVAIIQLLILLWATTFLSSTTLLRARKHVEEDVFIYFFRYSMNRRGGRLDFLAYTRSPSQSLYERRSFIVDNIVPIVASRRRVRLPDAQYNGQRQITIHDLRKQKFHLVLRPRNRYFASPHTKNNTKDRFQFSDVTGPSSKTPISLFLFCSEC